MRQEIDRGMGEGYEKLKGLGNLIENSGVNFSDLPFDSREFEARSLIVGPPGHRPGKSQMNTPRLSHF
jgi:hypothetical protein